MPDNGKSRDGSNSTPEPFKALYDFQGALIDWTLSWFLYTHAMQRSMQNFLDPWFIASEYFVAKEARELINIEASGKPEDFISLSKFNLQLAAKAIEGVSKQAAKYHAKDLERIQKILHAPEDQLKSAQQMREFMALKARALTMLALEYPKAIRDIGSEFGFHFNRPGYKKIDETGRMTLCQVLPNQPGVEVNDRLKPVLVAHPYVLGSNILAFLPGEQKSYVHAFANHGIPTYVRIIKDIQENAPVQVMTGEDDARDTALFCRIIRDKHSKPVTINGFCQGGFNMLVSLLSGKLEGLVDALITCAAPMDGSKSRGLTDYLEHLSPRFRRLGYAIKRLPNGNQIVDGKVMSWVYKLKSIDRESPLFTFYRDLQLFEKMADAAKPGINKTAAAINHWLIYDRTDLPVPITELSFKSYTEPISPQGVLPFELFGGKLELDYIKEKGIRFLICYAAEDDLVDPPSATAPANYIPVELTEFPKGHASIATSWSHPDSEYAVDKVFPNGSRGPVRFQMDLDKEISGSHHV